MSTDLELLAAICDEPDAIVPRLIYADWLEEQGDLRAEFIRAQCSLETLDAVDPVRARLEHRVHDWIRTFGKKWAKPLRPFNCPYEFRRGFADEVSFSLGNWLDRSEKLIATSPVRALTLTGIEARVSELVNCRTLGRVASLCFRSTCLSERWSARFFNSPYLNRLTHLDINDQSTGSDWTAALFDSSQLPRLTSLRLDGNFSDYEGVPSSRKLGLSGGLERLAASPLLGRLETLELSTLDVTDAAFESFANSPHLKGNLKSLTLIRNPEIGAPSVVALAGSPGLASLDTLKLWGNCPNDRSLQALADSTNLGRLGTLDLRGNFHWSAAGLLALGRSTSLVGLRTLSLSHVTMSAKYLQTSHLRYNVPAFAEFFESPLMGRLKTLNLSLNLLGSLVAEALAGSSKVANLQALDLHSCFLGDKGAIALAASPHLGSLAVLDLSSNEIGNAGALALARSLSLDRLHTLRLTLNATIDPATRRALVDRFGETACFFEPIDESL